MTPLRDVDIKKLWGLAAGRCAYPGCAIPLVQFAPDEDLVVIGEMAHVIARSPAGPRGRHAPSDNTYENLILLCPTHHTLVDKAPEGSFTPDQLIQWKSQHEDRMARAATDIKQHLPPGAIKLAQSTKEYVTLHLVITHTGERHELELPLDMLVGYVIPELVRLLDLPERFANAWPIAYHLHSKTQGHTLDSALTLRQNSVQDRETLSLHVHAEAG